MIARETSTKPLLVVGSVGLDTIETPFGVVEEVLGGRCGHDRHTVARHIVALSTYLGHAHVTDTYWYLQATPILMGQIAIAGEALHRGEVA